MLDDHTGLFHFGELVQAVVAIVVIAVRRVVSKVVASSALWHTRYIRGLPNEAFGSLALVPRETDEKLRHLFRTIPIVVF
mgnify:CR=1 FL=1